MKKIDEREMQKTTKEKQRQKWARETEAIVKRWELNNFVVHLKLGSAIFYQIFIFH